MSRLRICRVCGCDDAHACMTDDGPCFWIDERDDICSGCAAAGEHVVSMTQDWEASERVATCSCGFTARHPFAVGNEAYATLDGEIRKHWQAVVLEAA